MNIVNVLKEERERRPPDGFDLHDGFWKEIKNCRSWRGLKISLDKKFGKRKEVKYPEYAF